MRAAKLHVQSRAASSFLRSSSSEGVNVSHELGRRVFFLFPTVQRKKIPSQPSLSAPFVCPSLLTPRLHRLIASPVAAFDCTPEYKWRGTLAIVKIELFFFHPSLVDVRGEYTQFLGAGAFQSKVLKDSESARSRGRSSETLIPQRYCAQAGRARERTLSWRTLIKNCTFKVECA